MNPAITLQNVSIAFGHEPVLREANLTIERGARCCITGYNGSGKSTLLSLISGLYSPDTGVLSLGSGLTHGLLEQNSVYPVDATIFEIVAGGLGEIGIVLGQYTVGVEQGLEEIALVRLRDQLDVAEAWSLAPKVNALLQQLGLEPMQVFGELSGGWRKRVAIARSLVASPDVWLLDEPTNHLDIPAIEWLTEVIARFSGTVVFISHDRMLMQQVADQVIDIDRGKVKHWLCRYDAFVERRDAERQQEQAAEKQFDVKLAEEEAWIRQGIKARRTRNEGRVRALEALREARAARLVRGSMTLEVDQGARSGKIVCEFDAVDFAFSQQPMVKDFSWVVQRGDRVGLVGPNGIGKSTVIKLLLGVIQPDQGSIQQGTKLDVAYFDQGRESLPADQSVADFIGEGREFIEINGRSVHVVSYLKRFLFDSVEARGKIRTLSGGQQNRLLMAHLFTKPANLLVLDEPTNDLDIETLELLEELLMDYQGTVLLVSHDRAFLDKVVTSLLVFKGSGHIEEQMGGFSDWVARGGQLANLETASPMQQKPVAESAPPGALDSQEGRRARKAEQRRLKREIDRLEVALAKAESELEGLMTSLSEPVFFEQPEAAQKAQYVKAENLKLTIDTLYNEWVVAEEAHGSIKLD